MTQNRSTPEQFANIQVYRQEIHTDAGQEPTIFYSLGWGEEDTLHGDPITIYELRALYTLIGRVIEQETTK